MNWAEIGSQVVLAIIGVLITGLGTLITFLINKFVKDSKLKNILASLNEVVQKAVSEVYQTYVEALKKDGMFNAETQKEALNKALEIIKTNASKDVMDWLKANYTDIDVFLKSQIEAMIGLLKNKASSK